METQRQSALHHRHLAASARMETFSGWRLPASYVQEPAEQLERVRDSAGLSDASRLTKLDLRGNAGDLPVALPARVWILTPKHALITSPEPIAFAPSAEVTDVTSVYSAILLAGSKARQVLEKLTTLNVHDHAMPNGTARQARIAHVHSTLLRVDGEGVPGFLILNTRDLAEYLWDALLEAGDEFGVSPFGTVAQQKWLGA